MHCKTPLSALSNKSQMHNCYSININIFFQTRRNNYFTLFCTDTVSRTQRNWNTFREGQQEMKYNKEKLKQLCKFSFQKTGVGGICLLQKCHRKENQDIVSWIAQHPGFKLQEGRFYSVKKLFICKSTSTLWSLSKEMRGFPFIGYVHVKTRQPSVRNVLISTPGLSNYAGLIGLNYPIQFYDVHSTELCTHSIFKCSSPQKVRED